MNCCTALRCKDVRAEIFLSTEQFALAFLLMWCFRDLGVCKSGHVLSARYCVWIFSSVTFDKVHQDSKPATQAGVNGNLNCCVELPPSCTSRNETGQGALQLYAKHATRDGCCKKCTIGCGVSNHVNFHGSHHKANMPSHGPATQSNREAIPCAFI